MSQHLKKANIVPIFQRKIKVRAPGNYSPVILTLILGEKKIKIKTECPTLNTINKSLKGDDIINANQHGLIENRSCETTLLSPSHETMGLVDKDNSFDMI